MASSLPSPPRTVIVIDDNPHNVSFIRSVLEAHALPYEVQVMDHRDHAVDLFAPRSQHASQRAPTLLLLNRTLSQRHGMTLWRHLTTLWPSWTPARVRVYVTQRSPAARLYPQPSQRWPRRLAWGIGVGLLAGFLCSAPV